MAKGASNMKKRTDRFYSRRRMDLAARGVLDRGLGLLIALAGCWALIAAAILIIGAQH